MAKSGAFDLSKLSMEDLQTLARDIETEIVSRRGRHRRAGLKGEIMGKPIGLFAALLLVAAACAPNNVPAKAEGEVCGGIQGLACREGELCELPAGQCEGADLQGVCTPQPEVCTKEYRPVCGCDGRTYGNDCMRQLAGVQKDHDEACEAGS